MDWLRSEDLKEEERNRPSYHYSSIEVFDIADR